MEDIGSTRPTLRIILACVTPFLLDSIYIFFTRWPNYIFTGVSDIAALTVSVFIGAAFVATLPKTWPIRILLLAIYVPILLFVLTFYGFYFVGMVFDEWL